MDTFSEGEVTEIFNEATTFFRSIAAGLDTEKLLFFYARFKQANDGPCSAAKPGFFDFQGKQKWEAWKSLGNKTKMSAMTEYISELTNIHPTWETQVRAGQIGDVSAFGGVVVSTMANEDEYLEDHQKTVFDWCKEGDTKKMEQFLRKDKTSVNKLDGEGMALLHWASDRGNEDVVRVLLKHKANLNIQDADGQTPLHYAASCEHTAVVKLLLENGADPTITDTDGLTAAQASDSKHIIEILNNR